ncbi:MAG TPA: hypothetical protein VJ957_09110 [Longimicrobiales bacterium]|nr:hypothetical protein [Longimicrobiales bacterium]
MRNAFAILCIMTTLATPRHAAAQIATELHGGVGYTSVSVDAWAGTSAQDWGQMASGYYVQVFPYQRGRISVGGELGYEYFFWYDIFYNGYTSTRNVSATRVAAVARLGLGGPAYAEAAASMHLFDGFSDPGIGVGVGYMLPINEHFSVPLGLRGDLVLDPDTQLFASRFNVGIRYSF